MSSLSLSLCQVPRAEWPEISGSFRDLSFEQTLTYSEAAAARIGATTEFVSLKRGGELVAAASIRIKTVPGLGKGIAWIASGPLLRRRGRADPSSDDLRAVLNILRTYVCDRSGHILRLRLPTISRIDPDTVVGLAVAAGFVPTVRAATYRTILLDLTKGEEPLMGALHGKWRNALRTALRGDLKLDRGPISDLSERFHSLYDTVQAAKKFQPDIPPEFYYPLSGPDFEHEALIARKDGEDLAGITIGRAGRTLVYLFGATSGPGRKLNAGYFLIWQAVLGGLEDGLEWFDLGGIDANETPDVARFKRRTGGIEIAAIGPFEARPAGPVPALVGLAESLRARFKR